MVGVRPATLVGHPRTNHQSVMEYGLSDQPTSSDTLEPTPKCYGIWGCPTSPPRRTPSNQSPKCYGTSASVSAETTFYWVCHFRFSLARKFPFLEIEKPDSGDPGAAVEMLPSPFGGILAAGRRVAFPGARLERGIKLRITRRPDGFNRWQVRALGVAAPIRWADHT